MPNNKRRLPVPSRGSGSKKYLQGKGLLMLPENWKSVTLYTFCLIVIVVTIGLLYNPT